MVKYYDPRAGRVRDTTSDVAGLISEALADGSRRRMVEAMAAGEGRSVTELARVAKISVPGALKQVRVLERGGIVQCRKSGRTRRCSINPEAMRPFAEWATEQGFFWLASFDRLEKVIKKRSN